MSDTVAPEAAVAIARPASPGSDSASPSGPAWESALAALTAKADERPELLLAAGAAGGFLLALVLRRLGS